ncbi:MAG: HepT-like ribonuclease domain-containing protein [Cyanobacteria bacterium P01_F01_bin.143]
MSEDSQLLDKLQLVLSALERIPVRFASIKHPSDFMNSESGLEHMDSICMVLIAAGEEFKKIDRTTEGKLFAQYPLIEWRGAIGLRDVLAHGYFQVDPEQLYKICTYSIPLLIETLRQMIQDLE